MWKFLLNATLTRARRVVVGVIGGTLVVIGTVMLVTPGPGLVVIPLGLALLATEFVWARHLLREIRNRTQSLVGGGKVDPPPEGRGGPPPPGGDGKR